MFHVYFDSNPPLYNSFDTFNKCMNWVKEMQKLYNSDLVDCGYYVLYEVAPYKSYFERSSY